MGPLLIAVSVASGLSLLGWVYLVAFRGRFWATDLSLEAPEGPEVTPRPKYPSVSIVVPARNEADLLPQTLPSLLGQDYPGPFRVYLVDDRSEDGTAEVASRIGMGSGAPDRLRVIPAPPVEPGWTGKLWALQQGVRAARQEAPGFLLFTDADIAHPAWSLRRLVDQAAARGGRGYDLVSLMAHLRVESRWDRLLIPAFVYFFAKLYPFQWVQDPTRRTAAAAGGCLLVSRVALEQAGGLERVRGDLIDDCALARLLHDGPGPEPGRLWLGLCREVRSLRAYGGLPGIWHMVTRTAFHQLRYSKALLAATVLGMLLIYLAPVLGVGVGAGAWLLGASRPEPLLALALGVAAWLLMAASYVPMLRWYGLPARGAALLPVAGLLYTLMTLDSAVRTWRGRGGAWKGRTHAGGEEPGRTP